LPRAVDQLRQKHHLCRPAATECDIPEYCDGVSGKCPADIFKKNGQGCEKGDGYCYNGVCPVRDHQCQLIWGSGLCLSYIFTQKVHLYQYLFTSKTFSRWNILA
jgi:hypothetical protein